VGIVVYNRTCKKRKKGRVDIMFDMNYEEIYEKVKEKMADPKVTVGMKRALLSFEIGLRYVHTQELKEVIERGMETSPEDEDISHGC
jgi:hypothetical protein